MAHRTTVATSYKWRLILIALVCLGYAGLCVKDGAFTYPAQIEKRAFYNQFVEDNGPDPALWAAKARELGWPIEEPDTKEEKDILTQWVQFAIVFPIGFFHLCLFVRWGRRFIEGDEAGVRTNGGKSFTWDQVTEVDATKWDRKGIARIAYDTGGGKRPAGLGRLEARTYPGRRDLRSAACERGRGQDQGASLEPG